MQNDAASDVVLKVNEHWDEAFLARMGQFAEEIRSRYRPEQLQRLEAYMFSLLSKSFVPAHPDQHPSMGLFPELRARPWWEADESDVTSDVARALKASFPALQAELLANIAAHRAPFENYKASVRYDGLQVGSWQGHQLFSRQSLNPGVEASFPVAAKVIKELERHILGEVVYLVLQPGATIPTHSDFTNAQLTCHLGMIVPEGCTLTVARETRPWREGVPLFFDHSFGHSARNPSTQVRVILLLDIAHPDLTPAELEILALARVQLQLET